MISCQISNFNYTCLNGAEDLISITVTIMCRRCKEGCYLGWWHRWWWLGYAAKKLYPHMRQKLVNNMRISSIRVHYRYPTHLDESIIDIIAGIESLEHAGIQPVGFVGHSLGGSVVIEAASSCSQYH